MRYGVGDPQVVDHLAALQVLGAGFRGRGRDRYFARVCGRGFGLRGGWRRSLLVRAAGERESGGGAEHGERADETASAHPVLLRDDGSIVRTEVRTKTRGMMLSRCQAEKSPRIAGTTTSRRHR